MPIRRPDIRDYIVSVSNHLPDGTTEHGHGLILRQEGSVLMNTPTLNNGACITALGEGVNAGPVPQGDVLSTGSNPNSQGNVQLPYTNHVVIRNLFEVERGAAAHRRSVPIPGKSVSVCGRTPDGELFEVLPGLVTSRVPRSDTHAVRFFGPAPYAGDSMCFQTRHALPDDPIAAVGAVVGGITLDKSNGLMGLVATGFAAEGDLILIHTKIGEILNQLTPGRKLRVI